MLKKGAYTIFLVMMAFRLSAQSAFDGPYVFYKGNKVVVTAIERDDDLLSVKTVSHDDPKNIVLTVVPEGHADWTFKVSLRTTLSNDLVSSAPTGNCLFMSDIEGEFGNFRKLLLAAKVIDEQYHWTYGTGSLIVPGDLFDRGKDVVPELWLLYKLEEEAKAAGGSVIVILGNHDIMNLSGDHRYTDAKYFKDAWLMHVALDDLFDKSTELGRWLRTKNLIEKCGDVLVMHGGLSPAVLQTSWDPERLNARSRPYYDRHLNTMPVDVQLLFGKQGLFWYRGYFMAPKSTMASVDSTLAQFGCKYIVVGHTIVKWNIASFYGGKVIGVDVDEHAGHVGAALYAGGQWFTVDGDGKVLPLIYKAGNDLVTDKDIL